PAEAQGDQAEDEDENRSGKQRDGDDDDVDDEGNDPWRQYALEQFGMGRWIVSVRPEVGGDAVSAWSRIGSRGWSGIHGRLRLFDSHCNAGGNREKARSGVYRRCTQREEVRR